MSKYKVSRAELLQRARAMRSDATQAERLMWSRVRNKQLGGHKFRRQHIMKPYIVDFYCAAKKLVVEIDGDNHGQPGQQEADQKRQETLEEEYGVEVIRFSDEEVMTNTEKVLETILRICSGG